MALICAANHYDTDVVIALLKAKADTNDKYDVSVGLAGWMVVCVGVEHPLGLSASALESRWRCRGRVVTVSAMSMTFHQSYTIQNGHNAIFLAKNKNHSDTISVLEQVVDEVVEIVMVSACVCVWSDGVIYECGGDCDCVCRKCVDYACCTCICVANVRQCRNCVWCVSLGCVLCPPPGGGVHERTYTGVCAFDNDVSQL